MHLENFVSLMGRMVSSKNLKAVSEIIKAEKKAFSDFLLFNGVDVDEFVAHVFEAYIEGGLIVAS